MGAHLAVKNSIVSGNTALGNGGGLYVRNGNLLVEGSMISGGSRFGGISTLAA